jgi:hypothetical protein
LLAPDEVDRPPVHERQQPRRGLRPLGNEGAGAAPEAEERLLDSVLGEGLVAQDPIGEPVGGASDPVVELGERALLGPRDERDESLVRQVGEVAAAHLRR